jgi:hypothetical protein
LSPKKISTRAAELAALEQGPIHSSSILEYEMTFAVHTKQARGEIPSGSSGRVLTRFQTDLQWGRFTLIPLGIDIKTRTRKIAARTLQAKPPVFLRTLDGIHIATAMELGFARLITADKKMAGAALLLGLKSNFLGKIVAK